MNIKIIINTIIKINMDTTNSISGSNSISTEEKEKFIIDECTKYNTEYIKIENSTDIDMIYNLYKNDIGLPDIDVPEIVCYYFGIYYDKHKNIICMKKYYLTALYKGCVEAMYRLGNYYAQFMDFDLMKKYYLMAIDKGHVQSMINLGKYCYNINEFFLMRKYYLMAIEKGNPIAMQLLGDYYRHINNYELMEKYYLMAIDNGNYIAACNFGTYYSDIHYYDLMENYYLMAINHGNVNAMYLLGCYYKNKQNYDLMKKYYLMAIDNDKKNKSVIADLIDYYENIENNVSMAMKYYVLAINTGDKLFEKQLLKYMKKNIHIISDNLFELLDAQKRITELEIELKCIPEYGEYYIEAHNHWISNQNI